MKKICLLLAFCLLLAAFPAFAQETAEDPALSEQIQAAMEAEDYETAIPLIREVADAGDAQAQLLLGNCFAQGLGVEQDDREAVKYYRLSADQGNVYGLYDLAAMYEYGYGVAQSRSKALQYYQLAADQGFQDAIDKVNELK